MIRPAERDSLLEEICLTDDVGELRRIRTRVELLLPSAPALAELLFEWIDDRVCLLQERDELAPGEPAIPLSAYRPRPITERLFLAYRARLLAARTLRELEVALRRIRRTYPDDPRFPELCLVAGERWAQLQPAPR